MGVRGAPRIAAIDAVRGLVIVLMTLDHASGTFNRGRVVSDAASMVRPGVALDEVQFLVRWVTHLCAPTFLLLAGVSLALSVARRQRNIDRDLAIRGALLIAIEVGWMSWVWRFGPPLQLGVLYAIGASMLAMIALRRLPVPAVVALGVAAFVGGDLVRAALAPPGVIATMTVSAGSIGVAVVVYPFVAWLGFMMIGWAIGVRISDGKLRARDLLLWATLAAAVFVVARGANGYGNAGLLRADGSWLEWLHVSKYPPSLTYAALELALALALLAAAWRWAAPWRPLVLFGQTALFFYVLHVHLLKVAAAALGMNRAAGLGTTAVVWGAALLVLYPACRWYRGVKQRHPQSPLRYF